MRALKTTRIRGTWGKPSVRKSLSEQKERTRLENSSEENDK